MARGLRADKAPCPLDRSAGAQREGRCEGVCTTCPKVVELVVGAVGFGAFFTCFPGGSVGLVFLASRVASWQSALAVQMTALLFTALMALGYKNLLWESEGFPHAAMRRIAHAVLAGCVAGGYVVSIHWPSLAAGLLLAVVAGVAMAYPLLAWFQALQVVYRRAGRSRCLVVLVGSYCVCAAVGLAAWALRDSPALVAAIALSAACVSLACLERLEAPMGKYATRGECGRRGSYRLSDHAVPVLVSFGTTWGLACSLLTERAVAGSGSGSGWVPLVAGVLSCAVLFLSFRIFSAEWLAFGMIIRATVMVTGIAWVLAPVAAEAAPGALGVIGAAVYLLAGASMTFFSIEIAQEYGLSIPSVMPVNYILFVAVACVAGIAFGLFRTYAPDQLSWNLVAAAAVVASLATTPFLPSSVSDATMFTLDDLPENEGFDDRVERSRGNLVAKYGLTEREGEVAELLLQGMTREQIAQRLSISAWTVKDHVGRIYGKVGVHSAKELMRLVAGAGQ